MSSVRAGRQSTGRGALYASLLLILVATLSPGNWTEWGGGQARLWDGGLADILINVALFAPFGAALGRRGRTVLGALIIGAALAAAVETAQLGVPGRVSSLGDVLFDTIGTLVGWAFWRSYPIWGRPRPEIAARLTLAAACLVTAIIGLTGGLLRPSLPLTRYFGGWTNEFGHLEAYHGYVLDASVGTSGIPPGFILHSTDVRQRLVGGETLRVQAVAGPPVHGLAPLLSIHDERQREVLLLGPDGDDLVYRFRTRAAALGLDSPDLRFKNAMHGLSSEQPLMVEIATHGPDRCVEINRASTCGLGFTAGSGWGLLMFHQLPPWTHLILNVLWLGALLLPVGYWARARWECALAGGMVAVALLLVPSWVGLVRTPGKELVGACVGVLGGVVLQLLSTVRTNAVQIARGVSANY
jgi:hypothetical protein